MSPCSYFKATKKAEGVAVRERITPEEPAIVGCDGSGRFLICVGRIENTRYGTIIDLHKKTFGEYRPVGSYLAHTHTAWYDYDGPLRVQELAEQVGLDLTRLGDPA